MKKTISLLTAFALGTALTGCGNTEAPATTDDHTAAVEETAPADEHPSSEHPAAEEPADEHPTSEHPTDEHPSG